MSFAATILNRDKTTAVIILFFAQNQRTWPYLVNLCDIRQGQVTIILVNCDIFHYIHCPIKGSILQNY
jgi:hypothetical protein